jgi:hypothetical protein
MLTKLSTLVSTIVLIYAILHEPQISTLESEFINWMAEHGKVYNKD